MQRRIFGVYIRGVLVFLCVSEFSRGDITNTGVFLVFLMSLYLSDFFREVTQRTQRCYGVLIFVLILVFWVIFIILGVYLLSWWFSDLERFVR